ncbi:hypothetical protein QUA00_30565 [Microcoleus sp. T2B6]|uniref:hypothetical protein n=1 Tax=Microcoleus sp. T2B6 TaxID=3055424 RepID=UPI002FD16621
MQPNKFFHSQSYPFPPFQSDDSTESDRPSRIKSDRPSQQIPNSAMILRVARSPLTHQKRSHPINAGITL